MAFNAWNPDTVSVLSFDYDGVRYVAKPEPKDEECDGCAFIEMPFVDCCPMPSCSKLRRPDRRGIIWVDASQLGGADD